MGFLSTVCTRSANLCRSCLSAPSSSRCPALRAYSSKQPLSESVLPVCIVVSSSARTLGTICRYECHHAKVLQATAGHSGWGSPVCPMSLQTILH